MSPTDQAPSRGTIRVAMRWMMASFYFAAGVAHLAAPERFLPIVPDFVPMPHAVVLVTGLCEIAGSVALLTRLRRFAGVLLAIYAVCVFPANIKHAVESINVTPLPDSWWYHGPRLIMQPVLVWWALFCAEVIDWPCWQGEGDQLICRPTSILSVIECSSYAEFNFRAGVCH